MLKVKLFRAFALVVLIFGALSAVVGVRTINRHVLAEAQTRVRLDLSSAWAMWDAKLHEVEMVVRLAAAKQVVADMCEQSGWTDAEVRSRLERIRTSFGLDFLDVLAPDGKVMMRTSTPYTTGDFRISDPAVASVMQSGDTRTCLTLLSKDQLDAESDGLADRAYLEVEDTPRARRSLKKDESRGLVMVAAAAVRKGPQLMGVVYGGILVNRNFTLIDHIRDVVFKNELYNGAPMGTATVFLDDCRVATTVRTRNGNRAIGTRVSKEVADRVLDNGYPWVGEAFVVNDNYITAYEPIKDGLDRTVGMLYVGILKKPFEDTARNIVLQYLFLSLFVLVIALVIAFIIAGRLSQPIHRLVESSNRLSHGDRPPPVPTYKACHEIELLIDSFNQMVQTLADREQRLKLLNRSYMETLGFVSHELKSPVATIMNYVYLLRQQRLGPINEKQEKAIRAVDVNSQRLVEMVRHYLNLSRIENGDLTPVRARVDLTADVLTPLLDSVEVEVESRRMKMVNTIGPDVALYADLNLVREVFENLLSNAVKYGRDGGQIVLSASPEEDFVAFSVRNEGDGIAADKLGLLFQKFSRVNGAGSAKRQRGTGLGLFITRSIIEAHGGEINVTSQPGTWTEFTFTLPLFKRDAARGNEAGEAARAAAGTVREN